MASPDFPSEGDETDDMEGEEFIHWVRIHAAMFVFYCVKPSLYSTLLYSTLLHCKSCLYAQSTHSTITLFIHPIIHYLFLHSGCGEHIEREHTDGCSRCTVRCALSTVQLRVRVHAIPHCFDSHTVLILLTVPLSLCSSPLQSAPPLLPTIRTREEVLQRQHTGLPRLLLQARWHQYW
jgi:hypothetical protein